MFFIRELASFSKAHRRAYNQDRCFFMNCDGEPDLQAKMSILCVMDGVSNSNGEEASRMASRAVRPVLAGLLGKCDLFLNYDDATREDEFLRTLREAILEADLELRRHQLAGMEYGTTITLAVVFDEAVYTANVGDSPAYLLRVNNLDGKISGIQSLYKCQNEAGERVRSQSANVLTQMVGGSGVSESRIHTASAWLGGSDVLLLGTDGALAVLPEEKMVDLFNGHLQYGLQAALDALYEEIEKTPSTDNATVMAQWLEI